MNDEVPIRQGPFRIGEVRVDPDQLILESAAGRSQLEPKVMQLLQALAGSAGKTVTREALIDLVWGVRFGGDESLTRAVHMLRKALTAPHQLEKIVRTIPRRGYVLEAEISAADAVPARALAFRDDPLLAVLPFDNLSSDPDMVFFSDGVSEDILRRIVQGTTLRVAGRTSSFQFRGPEKAKAAISLNATHVVDGSIRRAANKVRITAHLSEVETQMTLWTEGFDRDLEDIFDVQDEISKAVAAALDSTFVAVKVEGLEPAIYDLYIRSRNYDASPASVSHSASGLETVTRIAPNFADGWASYARGIVGESLNQPYAERTPAKARARAALARCYELDNGNLEATAAEWLLCDPFSAYLEQETVAARICEAGTNVATPQAIFGYHLLGVGRNVEATEVLRRARDLDLRNPFISALSASSYWHAGLHTDGRRAMEAHLLTWPDDHLVTVTLITLCVYQKDWAAVDKLIDPQRLAQFPLREFSGVVSIIPVLRDPETQNTKVFLDLLEARVKTTGHIMPADLIWPAEYGFIEESLNVTDHAKFGPSGSPDDRLGYAAYRSVRLFADAYPNLRADPRFVKLCARLGLVEYWLDTGMWPDCSDEVPYDFREECEKHRDYPKDKFFEA